MRQSNRASLRRAVEFTVKRGWEITLISEIRAELEGVIYLGGKRKNSQCTLEKRRSNS